MLIFGVSKSGVAPPFRIRKWNYLVNITAHCVASFNFSIYCHFVMETLLLLDNDE